jgi:hypothetical protein
MSPRQEIVNALTMFIAPTFSWWIVLSDPSYGDASDLGRRMAALQLYGLLWHMPFSQMYHLKCALDTEMHQTSNPYVRLDISNIHVASAVYAYTLYGPADSWFAPFMAVVIAWNAYSAASKWRNGPWGQLGSTRNLVEIVGSVLLYAAAMLARGDIVNLCGMMTSFVVGGLVFKFYPFGGYSHAIFHVICGIGQQWFCLQSALAL